MKGVQCYELFGGIALKIHTFSFSFSIAQVCCINHAGVSCQVHRSAMLTVQVCCINHTGVLC